MFQSTLEILYLLLPAITANMAPVFATHYDWLPHLNLPLDGRLHLRTNRLLGDSKTARGLLSGLLFGVLTGLLQYLLSSQSWALSLSLINYSSLPGVLVFSAAISFGALLGDAVESFIKRRLKKPAGFSWIPYDQIDFAIGALVLATFFAPLNIMHFISAVAIIGLGSYLVSYAGVRLHIKQSL